MIPYQSFPQKFHIFEKLPTFRSDSSQQIPTLPDQKGICHHQISGGRECCDFKLLSKQPKQWKPLTHNNWKNYTFKMQTQDESEAQILTGHTVVAVDLWVALQINVQFTYQVHHVHPGKFLRHGYQKPWFKKWKIR